MTNIIDNDNHPDDKGLNASQEDHWGTVKNVPMPKARPAEAGLSSADYDTYGLDRKDYSRGLQFKLPGMK